MTRSIRSGFTLIELLVVIAIIAMLAAILFPVFITAKASGQRSSCAANLKQITSALQMYVDDNGGRFPGVYDATWDIMRPYMNRAVEIAQLGGGLSAKRGPYMQDFLAPYIKNSGVWMCPAVKANGRIPSTDYEGQFKVTFPSSATWEAWSVGVTPAGRNTPSNYLWIWKRYRYINGKESWPDVSGASVSGISQPTKAAMFLEGPYWNKSAMPHQINSKDVGLNASYYDGHVKFVSCSNNMVTWATFADKGWAN